MRNNAAHFGFMNDAFCAHMLPVKRCPLFACSGHFRVIVTHSDTLKEMDCSGPGGPRGDHPLRHSRGHYLFAPSKATFKRCRQKLRWRQMLCFAAQTFFSTPLHRINPRLGEGGYFGRHRLKLLRSGVIVGYGDARCCYRQLGRSAPRCPLQFVLRSRPYGG